MRSLSLALLSTSLVHEAAACTALAVDGEASVSGYAYAVENVDCDNCDFRLTYVPPQDYPQDAKRPVYLQKAAYPRYVGYDRSEIYRPVEGQKAFEAAMQIPQVSHTFGYYESACPLMNDQGLGIAESSCSAMLLNKAPTDIANNRSTPVAILDAAALMQLVLERCATAKCGVELMGQLCEDYGYLPFFGEPTQGVARRGVGLEWDDAGEAYTLADKSGEAWVVHVLGGVEGHIKSIWAAQRVPKGHVAPVANEFTIGELPEEPNEDFLFPRNIREAARVSGLWDGHGSFHFSRVFAPAALYHSAPASSTPIPLYSSLRKWRLLSLFAPSLELKFEREQINLPFSVKAERKVTRRDIMAAMRDHYAGTEFDMTKGILAGPWGTPFRPEGKPQDVDGLTFSDVPRGISILRSIYSTISETGPDGARFWFGPDTAATSVYMPIDHRTTSLSPMMFTGTYRNFTRESAFWAFNYVANWMQLNYQGMSTEDVQPRQVAWQDTLEHELAALGNAGVDELTQWQTGVQERIVRDWWKLADTLVVKWNDFENFDEKCSGCAWKYPTDFAKMVGLSNDIHPVWVAPALEPPAETVGYVPSSVSLPRVWDHAARVWKDWAPVSTQLVATAPERPNALGFMQAAVFGAVIFIAGFAVGRRQPVRVHACQEPLIA